MLVYLPTQVTRLYRNSLKVLCSWAIDRDIFIDEATKMRARFDAERGCNPGKALRLLRVSIDNARAFEYFV
jgi:NADH dehydrogenase (ubiquinone) 1 beta subcomplex subunit 9